MGLDPIEKKPLYHFFPGSKTLSIALFGCNFRCQFCQNHRISQIDSPDYPLNTKSQKEITTPKQLVQRLNQSGSSILSYTYSDPVVWLDYVEQTASLVHQQGKYNCMITNGSFTKSSLQRLLPLIDAFNIDVKGDNAFYQEYCNGALKPVLDAVQMIAKEPLKVLEITTLVIEGLHTKEQIRFLGQELFDRGVQVWHLSRFHPSYKMMGMPATSEAFLDQMLDVAQQSGIPYIYAGNSNLRRNQHTSCPQCHYTGPEMDLSCPQCGTPIYGRFRLSTRV
jgi:pyruvate formate lyase activating enzyme